MDTIDTYLVKTITEYESDTFSAWCEAFDAESILLAWQPFKSVSGQKRCPCKYLKTRCFFSPRAIAGRCLTQGSYFATQRDINALTSWKVSSTFPPFLDHELLEKLSQCKFAPLGDFAHFYDICFFTPRHICTPQPNPSPKGIRLLSTYL